MIRWLTGLALLGLILLALWLGGAWWLGFVAVFLAVAGLEWGRMGESEPFLVTFVILLGFGYFVAQPDILPDATIPHTLAMLVVLGLIPILPILFFQDPFRVRDWMWSLTGLIWLAVPASLLYQLREEAGLVLLIVMLAATALQDTVALYAGKFFGTPGTLSPGLSPNKSMAGGLANVLGAIFCFLVGAYWVQHAGSAYVPEAFRASYWTFAVVGTCLGISGQLGDLLISALKRRVQLDDAGGFLPGHGGVLDRADGLLVNTVVFFLLLPLLQTGLG